MVTEKGDVHVLLVSLSPQGHLNPMLLLGKVLVAKGLHVTLATTETARKMFHYGNFSSTNSNLNVEFFSDGFADDFERDKKVDVYFESLPTNASHNLSQLIQKLSKVRNFGCIITNLFCSFVADVATQHGIPCAMLWIQPCAIYAIYYRFYKDLNPFPTTENLETPINLPGLPLLDVNEIPAFIHPSTPFPGFKKGLANTIQSLDKVKWLLGNSFYELEDEIVESMKQLHGIIPIGPLVPSTMLGKDEKIEGGIGIWKAEDTCLEWLDKKDPSSVVYISFGSITVLSDKQMDNIALALRKINKPFLWVVKPKVNEVSDGMGNLPSWFIHETKEQGLVVPWCTQTMVLTHPSIACFMSHCGWNSLLEAIASGVPVIGFPQWTDQTTNSKLLTHVFKTGVKLGPLGDDGIVSTEDVKRCILETTEGRKAEELRNRATKMKEAARRATADGGSSDVNIQLFIDEISGTSLQSEHLTSVCFTEPC